MTNKVYIGNLNYSVDEDILRKIFEEYGEVEDVKIIVDRNTGRSKGFAFVTMNTAEAAGKAINDLQGAELEGRQIKISEAREQRNNNRNRNKRW
jgi:RNA recognition motif-containing protein